MKKNILFFKKTGLVATSLVTTDVEPANASALPVKNKRIESIDLLRGIVMIIMALDHTRDYFHKVAFRYEPTDLSQTSVYIFFTRWVTHFCAPVFVFLAGIAAYLYGTRKSKKELSFFLFTRGLWLVFAEMTIVTLAWTFNPAYPLLHLQVIWAIGISMIVLSALVYMDLHYILFTGLVLVFAHNLLDQVHVPGTGGLSIFWSFLHDPGSFKIGRFTVNFRYPVLPWIGIIAIGYCFGSLYRREYNPEKRMKSLLVAGFGAIALFIILRSVNVYGDAATWSAQKNVVFSFLSFLKVTKYPPSLLYILMTLGPALIFLAFAEKPLNAVTARIAMFGRVPMFYYVAHLYLIHLFAVNAAIISGLKGSDMILSGRVNLVPGLKEYGFNLVTVYLVWIAVILILYPLCKWFDRYKRANQSKKWWLSYV